MIKEDYCSAEVAELLREKGAGDDIYFGYYTSKHNNDGTSDIVNTCTHQMAMKWLREMGWHILCLYDFRFVNINLAYIPILMPIKGGGAVPLKEGGFSTYEEAIDAALKYALNKYVN
ncbi:MAG: hypothetical protein IJU02_07010 [Lachnospiraceae bacterium]|nr:hypothetical protein [Lachnospiraceae bacterium]